MTELQMEEIIEVSYATFGPMVDISAELEILIKSDDGGRHLEFSVQDHESAQFLRKEISHTYEGLRTIIRYRVQPQEE
ncbi:MAG TPA: hypothetical protein DCX27_12530 [Balneola sp.]|nr:hypothetical protein [Balneola sp.]|tara:strand:- start:589 stop:822 length:234 start_codon:yes stop_codon:yes gene_type:complete